jgi:hypothetical protein
VSVYDSIYNYINPASFPSTLDWILTTFIDIKIIIFESQ